MRDGGCDPSPESLYLQTNWGGGARSPETGSKGWECSTRRLFALVNSPKPLEGDRGISGGKSFWLKCVGAIWRCDVEVVGGGMCVLL